MYSSSEGSIIHSDFYEGGRSTPKRTGKISTSDSTTDGPIDSRKENLVLNLEVFTAQVKEFIPYKDVPISLLSQDLHKRLTILGNVLTTMQEKPEYPSLVEIVTSAFGNVTEVIPGSVGGFFYGCFVPNGYAGPSHCSAECAGNVVPPNVPGWEVCGHTVFLLTKSGNLEVRHRTESTHGIVHVVDGEFRGLSAAQIDQLKKMNIETVDIDVVGQNGYIVHGQNLKLSEVQRSHPKPRPVPPKPHPAEKPTSSGWTASTALVSFIVFFVILILICVVLWKAFSNKSRDIDAPYYVENGSEVVGVASSDYSWNFAPSTPE